MIYNTKIGEKLKGQKILGVVVDSYGIFGVDDTNESSLDRNGGDIYILLENGYAIKCWNSEWGGISLGKIEKNNEIIIFKES